MGDTLVTETSARLVSPSIVSKVRHQACFHQTLAEAFCMFGEPDYENSDECGLTCFKWHVQIQWNTSWQLGENVT